MTNHHKGNKRFRDIVALHRPDYVRAPKIQKPSVARVIVRAIRNGDPPGRFLRKDDKTGKWVDIGDKKAAEKTSQALREKTIEERDQTKTGDGTPQGILLPGGVSNAYLIPGYSPAVTTVPTPTMIMMTTPTPMLAPDDTAITVTAATDTTTPQEYDAVMPANDAATEEKDAAAENGDAVVAALVEEIKLEGIEDVREDSTELQATEYTNSNEMDAVSEAFV